MPRTDTRNVLLYDREQYTMEGLKNMDKARLRSEYSRLRRKALDRLANFEGTEWIDSETYKTNNPSKFPKLAGIKSNYELKKLTVQLATYLTAKTSTVTGLKHQRNEFINTFRSMGFDWVNKKNFKRFSDFMTYYRSQHLDKMFDSDQVVKMYHELVEKRKISSKEVQDNFEFWADNQDKLKDMPVKVNKEYLSSDELKKRLK